MRMVTDSIVSGYFIEQDTGDSDDDGNTDEFLRTPVDDEDKPTTPKRYHYNEEAVTRFRSRVQRHSKR